MLSPTHSREGEHHQAELDRSLLEMTRMEHHTNKENKTSEKIKPFLVVSWNISAVLTMFCLALLQKCLSHFAHPVQENSIGCQSDHHSQKTPPEGWVSYTWQHQ